MRIQGLYGAGFIWLNMKFATFRKRSVLRLFPVTEVVFIAFITALINYPTVFMRFFTILLDYMYGARLTLVQAPVFRACRKPFPGMLTNWRRFLWTL